VILRTPGQVVIEHSPIPRPHFHEFCQEFYFMVNKKLFGIITFIYGLLLGMGISAQNTQELRLGSSLQGVMRDGREQWYSIRHTEDSFITVETSGSLDTYIELYDSSRNLLAENDDGGEDANARVEFFASAGRTYLFKVRGYNDEVNGSYRVWASNRPLPRPSELRFGALTTATLPEGGEQWYSIRPGSNGFIVIETFRNSFDTYLEAYDSSWKMIAENDDGGEGTNARIELSVEAAKTYIFKLKGLDRSEYGSYQISASFEAIPPDTERNTERSRAVTARLGEAVQVYFRAPSESRWYRYEISRNGTTFVVQTRGGLDTILNLYDGQGNRIAEDDDSGEGLNASILQRLNAGIVYIEVKEISGNMGRCTLHLETR
jgi:hypothetical protein